MMGKPAKMVFASIMLVAILSISITVYAYADHWIIGTHSVEYHKERQAPFSGDIIHYVNMNSTGNYITIQWLPPNEEPKDYRVAWVETTEENFKTFRNLDYNAYPTTPWYTIEDLEEDTEYKIKIRPRYSDGFPGPWTDNIIIRTYSTIPHTAPEPTPEPTPEPEPEPTPEDHAAEMTQMQAKLDAANANMTAMKVEMTQMQAKLDAANANMTAFKDRLALSRLMVYLYIDQWGDYPEDNSISAEIQTPLFDMPLPESFIRVNGTEFNPGDTITITGKLYEHFEALQTGIFFDPDASHVDRRSVTVSFSPDDGAIHPINDIYTAPGQIICTAYGTDHRGDGLTMRTNNERYGYPYCLEDMDDSTFSLTYMIPEDTPAGEYLIFVKHQLNWESMHVAGNFAKENFLSIPFTIN